MRRELGWLMAGVGVCVLALAFASQAWASHHHVYRHHPHHSYHRRLLHRRHPPVVPFHAALLEDADSGQVLYADDADLPWPPASMAKMMLLLVTERQIQAGRLSLDSPVVISRRSAATGGSGIPLREGQVYPLRELIKAALIRSANDAAVAIAEKVGGSVPACVRMMNEEAQALGLSHTHYRTPDGLPPTPGHDVDVTDAYDLAKLARTLIGTTDLLRWSGMETCPFDHGLYILHNTNHLIGHFEGCDGLKTGFTFQAGFNLTATAKRGNLRLVSVVLGAPSNPARFRQSERLLQWGFDHWKVVEPLRRGQTLPVLVRLPSGTVFHPVAGRNVRLVVPKKEAPEIEVTYRIRSEVRGPLAMGSRVGEIYVRQGERILSQVAAVSPVAVGEAGTMLPAAAARSERAAGAADERSRGAAAIRSVLGGAQ